MKVLALYLFISTVVIVACFALSGELRHPSRETLEVIAWMSILSAGFMWLGDLLRGGMSAPTKPAKVDEDDFL